METVSYLVLILLCLVGYSAGAVAKAGKALELRPQIVDLILVLVIWVAAIYSKVSFDLNKWLVVLVWVIISIIVGVLAVWPRKLSEENVPSKKGPGQTPGSIIKRLWRRWGDFSGRMGHFHSRVVLSLFYFAVVSPFALAVRLLSDPLGIRRRREESHWITRIETDVGLDQLRRQF